MALKEKRKAEGLPEDYEEPKAKKVAPVIDGELVGQVNEMRDKALKLMVEQMQDGTEGIYKTLHGADWEEGAMFEAQRTRQRQLEARRKQAALEETERRRKENETVSLAGTGVYLDDLDPRY